MQHKGTITLTTDRLTLRRFRSSDAVAMYEHWAHDEEVTRFMSWEPHPDVDESARIVEMWIARYDDPTTYIWAIEPREVGHAIGSISIVSHDDCTHDFEVGYCIGRAFWHQGYTSEALGAVIGFLFDEVGAGRVHSCHDIENPRSGMVMRRAGMTCIGTARRAIIDCRGIVDMVAYDILPEDWAARIHAQEIIASQGGDELHPLGMKTPADSHTETTHLLRHEDINGTGRLFGGRLMEWIDDAAGIAAKRHCGASITTACVDTLEFRKPAFLDDVVAIVARVTYVGRSSLEVRVDSYVEEVATGARTLVNQAYLTEVCVDEHGKPQAIPYGLALTRASEYQEWEAALFRREVKIARRQSGI